MWMAFVHNARLLWDGCLKDHTPYSHTIFWHLHKPHDLRRHSYFHTSSTKSVVNLKNQSRILQIRCFQSSSAPFISPQGDSGTQTRSGTLGQCKASKLDGHHDLCWGWCINTFSSPSVRWSFGGPLWHFVSSKASIKAIWLGIDWLGSLSLIQSPFGRWAQRGCRPESYQSQHKAPSTLS